MKEQGTTEFQAPMKRRKRFLVGKLARRGHKDNISQDEVTQAILRFKNQGGLIKELPPEERGSRHLVGNPGAAAYESVIEH